MGSQDALVRAEALIARDMADFRDTLETVLVPQRAYLSEVEYALYRKGKKIRPLLLLLCARMVWPGAAEERLPLKILRAAVSTEMLHSATLIHDDIIDRATVRRGASSVPAARGNELAILIGDLQFVEAIRCFTDSIETTRDMSLVKLVLNTTFRICCGEIDELLTDPRRSTRSLRAQYLRTIERKTAILFGLACECGAALGGSRSRAAVKLGFYGRRVGRAFQMMDDAFDIVSEQEFSGKTEGIDLARRRLSLPLIYAMEELGPRHAVSRIMRGAPFTPEELSAALHAVRQTNAVQRVWQDARREIYAALEYLQDSPDNLYRQALRDVAEYVVDRASSDALNSPLLEGQSLQERET